MPENIDYFDKDDLKKVYDVFKAEKEKSLAAAERGMTDIVAKVEGMTAEQLQENKELAIEAAYLKALQTDKKAILQITDQKALEFDDAMKEAEANSELVGLVSDEANDYKLKTIKSKNYTADLSKSCLKPSKTQLVNLNLIEIK